MNCNTLGIRRKSGIDLRKIALRLWNFGQFSGVSFFEQLHHMFVGEIHFALVHTAAELDQ
jgi:hypothetical protein